jgi:arylsulfatase A-like enzyme
VGGVDPRLYGDQLHVPWLMRLPDGFGRLSRSSALVTHCDILPTIAELGGIARQQAANCAGSSVLPLASATPSTWRTELIAKSRNGRRAIRTAEWCLRQDAANHDRESTTQSARHSELYVRPDDRWESNDVAKLCPEVVESLSAAIDSKL